MVDKKLNVEKTKKLIEEYEKHRCLWDVKHKDFHNKHVKGQALEMIAEMFGLSVKDVESLLKSLRSSYGRQLKYISDSMRRGAGSAEVFIPRWVYFNEMQFLKDSVIPRKTTPNAVSVIILDVVKSENESVDWDPRENASAAIKCESESLDWDPREYVSVASSVPIESPRPTSAADELGVSCISDVPQVHNGVDVEVPPKKRRATVVDTRKADNLIDLAVSKLTKKKPTTCEAFANWVGTYLESLAPEKQSLAMMRINEVMFNINYDT